MKIVDLRTQYRINPVQVGTGNPVFSWRAEATGQTQADPDAADWYQKAYRIRVWMEDRQVWDSGMVESRRMNQIVYEGEKLCSDCRYRWNVEVMQEKDGRILIGEEAWFETGLLDRKDWKGCWIGEEQDEVYHLFRKSFFLTEKPVRAKLYICGLGQAECFLNGKRIGDAVLEPGWTDYRKTCLYTTYDVTELLQSGENALCVELGDGMYNVRGGRYVYFPRSYGKRKLLAQLSLIGADGSRSCVVSDESWQMGPSPIQFCCIYGGEDYDGRISRTAPSFAEFVPDASWKPALRVQEPEGILRASQAPSVKVMEQYEPVRVKEQKPGVFLYDLGKNFSGWVRIRVKTNGKMAGMRIVMTPSEILTPQGEPDQRVTGKGYAWTYICNEKKLQEFAPDFTYTGFRYVKVEGAVPADRVSSEDEWTVPVLETLTGEFLYPDMEMTGSFSCSNELFNRIHAIIRQAMLSNIKSYFTDCPHREKLPWLEETHLIGPAMLCSFELSGLYEKIEQDMADSQRESGLVADICPEYVTGFDKWNKGFVDSPEWGSACVLNPWHLYRKYGNTQILKQWYPVMKKYTDYLTGTARHGIVHHGLGDWRDIGPCTPYSQNTPVAVTATCIYYIDLDIMRQTAALLGYTEDEQTYEKQMAYVYEEYNGLFLDEQTGRYANGSQACQAMSLMAGFVPEHCRDRVLRQLKDEVVKRNYAITAGDVGHPYLVAALTEYGMSDVLNKMTNITETPGYGYQVVNGATTLTEDWDGPQPGKPHGSQNHLMLGSIDEWFFTGLGGIGSIRRNEPFDRIRIRPHIAEGMDECSVSVMHPYGKISVSWKKETDHTASVRAVIPPGVTASLESEDGSVKREVGSGVYIYSVSAG